MNSSKKIEMKFGYFLSGVLLQLIGMDLYMQLIRVMPSASLGYYFFL